MPQNSPCFFLCSPDSDWSSDLEDSQLSGGSASLSDDTGGSGPAAAAGARRAAAAARSQRSQRSPSPAKVPRLDTSYITSAAQLKVGVVTERVLACAQCGGQVQEGLLLPRQMCSLASLPRLLAPTLPTSSHLPLQDIGSSDLSAMAAAWFPAATSAAAFFPGGTLRLKSRKPVVVAMSAVW